MIRTKRIALALPLAVAGVLNVLIVFADRLHLRNERIAGLGFLFGIPWAWLLDRGWIDSSYLVVLWGPAILYSACLWLLFRCIRVKKPAGT